MPVPPPEPNPAVGGDPGAVTQAAADAAAGLEKLANEATNLGERLDKSGVPPGNAGAPALPPPPPSPIPPPPPPLPPGRDTTGLAGMGAGIADAIKFNFIQGMVDRLKAGKQLLFSNLPGTAEAYIQRHADQAKQPLEFGDVKRLADEYEDLRAKALVPIPGAGAGGMTPPLPAPPPPPPPPPPIPAVTSPAPAGSSLAADAELLRRKPSHEWGAAEWEAYQRLEGHVASQREEQYRQQAARMGQTGGAPVGPEPGTPEYSRQVEQQRLDALDRSRGVAPPVPPNVPPGVPPGVIPPVMPPAVATGLNVPGPAPSPIPAPGRPVVTSSPQEQQAVEDEFRRLQETIARTREAEDKAAAALAQETEARQEGRSTTEGFAAALSRARTDLTKLSPEMNALQAAFGVAKQLASAASPTHVQTFDRSIDLLQAKLGSYLLPAFDQLSLQIQKTARLFDLVPPSVRGGLSEYLAGGVRAGVQGWGQLLPGGSFTASIYGATQGVADKVGQQVYNIPGLGDLARRFDQSELGKWIGGKLGLGDTESPMRSYAGLPPAQTMGYEQYAESMQTAAANASPLDSEILSTQLANLPEMNANIAAIADTMRGLQGMFPPTLWVSPGSAE